MVEVRRFPPPQPRVSAIASFSGLDGLEQLAGYGVRVTAEPATFRAEVLRRPLGRSMLLSIRSTPFALDAAPPDRTERRMLAFATLSGDSALEQDGVSAVSAPDSVHLARLDLRMRLRGAGSVHLLGLVTPVGALALPERRMLGRVVGRATAASPVSAGLIGIMRAVLGSTEQERESSAIRLDSAIVPILGGLVSATAADLGDPGFDEIRSVAAGMIQDPEVSVVEIAAVLHTDAGSINRVAERHGTTIRRMLTELRADRLAELLRVDPGSSRSARAALVGVSPTTASRIFRERFGTTMRESGR